jgi:RNA polymerase sigma factor (sigma-70 family)
MSESASQKQLFTPKESEDPSGSKSDNPIHYFSTAHWKRTYGHAYSIAGNPEDAEDVAQETYVRLFETFITGRKIESCVAWIRGVMRRVVVDHFRESRPDLHISFVDADDDGNDNQGSVVADIADGSTSIEERLAEESLVRESLRVLASLPDRDRECVLMYARDYKFTQIAKALGISYELAIETTRKALAKTRRSIARGASCKPEIRRKKHRSVIGDWRPSKTDNPELVSTPKQDRYSFGDVVVDVITHRVFRGGQRLEFSSKELELLIYFLFHPGEILSRDRLLREVWGYTHSSETRTLDTHVSRIREKIEPITKFPRFVITVRGLGYKFVVDRKPELPLP